MTRNKTSPKVYVSHLDGVITVWVIAGRRAYPFDTAAQAFEWMTGGTISDGPANDRYDDLIRHRRCVWDNDPPTLARWTI